MLVRTASKTGYNLRRETLPDSKLELASKGGVTRATKLLQLATKSDFNAC